MGGFSYGSNCFRMIRQMIQVLALAAICLALWVFGRLIWTPDPVWNLLSKAQRLENAGAIPEALACYDLIATRHPESSYAPDALAKEADLFKTQGEQSSDDKTLRRAAALYLRLAKTYPDNLKAPSALDSAGKLASDDLHDRPLARAIYTEILQQNGERTEVGADALVQLARLAIQDGDGKGAQRTLQDVIRKWNGNDRVGAQAQYFLGVCYETLFKNRDWATRAYDQVRTQYPTSEWAEQATSRLGLLIYSQFKGLRPTRRVLLDIAPLPDDQNPDAPDGSIWSALRIALAARGLSGDPDLSRGYSLAPFYVGMDTSDAGKVITPPFDAWENAASAAGYRYSIKGGGREDEALRDLQDELDAAHLPLVCWQDGGKTVWSLCVGYDSERAEVMLQNRGAQFDTLAAKTWAAQWKTPSEFGKPYTMIALIPPGLSKAGKRKLIPTPTATATGTPADPNATPTSEATPVPIIATAPAFVWQIAPLKEDSPVRRTARRAAILLTRGGTDTQLLGIAALDAWTQTLDGATRETRTPISTPPPLPTPSPSPTPDSVYDPTPTSVSQPQATPTPSPREFSQRAGSWWPFWGAPVRNWIARRKEAASWCRLAALKTRNPRLNDVADSFDSSAASLEQAAQLAANVNPNALDKPDALAEIAQKCREARDAEKQAAWLLASQ